MRIYRQLCPSAFDKKFFTSDEIKSGWRLACKNYITGKLIVEIPAYSSLENLRILSRGKRKKLKFNPAIIKKYIEIIPPTLKNQQSYVSLLKDKLNIKKIDLNTIQHISEILNNFDNKVTGVIKDSELLTIEGGDTREKNYGIAFDIGTTTVVGFLVSLNSGKVLHISSRANLQISSGADIISRIAYSIKSKDNLLQLHQNVIDTINYIIDQLIKKSGISKYNIYELTIAGNTVMSHLLLKISPESLSHSPFTPVFTESIQTKAKELKINVNPEANVYIFPNIGGFIGGDIISGMLVHNIEKSKKIKIAIDIGTNGETVIGNKYRMIACSNAMGPAFEGAHISCGMPAMNGAINKIDFLEDEVNITVIGNTKPSGICGSALIDLLANLLNRGIINEKGKFNNPEDLKNNVPEKILERLITIKNQTAFLVYRDRNREIVLMQSDIRELQLAKAAVFSAIKILMGILGVSIESVSEIFIAGAFGNYIRPENALRIGLIPDISLEKIKPVGNTAGEGAINALISRNERKRAELIAKKIEHIELSLQKKFQDEFTGALFFP